MRNVTIMSEVNDSQIITCIIHENKVEKIIGTMNEVVMGIYVTLKRLDIGENDNVYYEPYGINNAVIERYFTYCSDYQGKQTEADFKPLRYTTYIYKKDWDCFIARLKRNQLII